MPGVGCFFLTVVDERSNVTSFCLLLCRAFSRDVRRECLDVRPRKWMFCRQDGSISEGSGGPLTLGMWWVILSIPSIALWAIAPGICFECHEVCSGTPHRDGRPLVCDTRQHGVCWGGCGWNLLDCLPYSWLRLNTYQLQISVGEIGWKLFAGTRNEG